MLDFGWPELFLIMVVAVIVIGPNELPVIMRGMGRLFRRFQYVKYAISRQFDDVMREADLDDIRDSVNFESRYRAAPDAEEAGTFDEAEADAAYDVLPENDDFVEVQDDDNSSSDEEKEEKTS